MYKYIPIHMLCQYIKEKLTINLFIYQKAQVHINLCSIHYSLIVSFKTLEALNFNTFDAGIVIFSFVAGLIP